ncbi:pyridoxal-phosphate dependent enzyme [bacterium]|nr:pyridoxal-phosphate dependent enzyme [bacterium]
MTHPPRSFHSAILRVGTLLVIAGSPLVAQSSGRAFTPEDWYKIQRVGAGVLSPDGNTLAFTVTTVLEDKDLRHTEVWIQPVAGGAARRMTAPAFESTAPRWSDDGKTLYFTSQRPGSRGTSWAVRMDEGGEAFAVARQRLKGGLAVTDAEVKRAMALAFRHLKVVTEPGGAVGIAAVMCGRMPIKGRTVVVVASGGNVDAALFREALAAA